MTLQRLMEELREPLSGTIVDTERFGRVLRPDRTGECAILFETMPTRVKNLRVASTLCGALMAVITVATVGTVGNWRASAASGDSGTQIHWAEADGGQVKLDGKTPLKWNLYQPDKKDKKKEDADLVLVLLGRRYLLIDTKGRLVYEVKPGDLKAQGAGFESSDLAQSSRVVPSTEWTSRDVGPAELFDLTLEDYGSVLEIQIPHPFIITPPIHYY